MAMSRLEFWDEMSARCYMSYGTTQILYERAMARPDEDPWLFHIFAIEAGAIIAAHSK
jgi:hypothetical protein